MARILGTFYIFVMHFLYAVAQPKCSTRWLQVYWNDKHGNALGGDKRELIQAALTGSPVRLCLQNYCSSLEYLQVINNNLCGQAIFHISKQGYNGFQDNAYWWFSLASTTGDFHMARYNVGAHTSRTDSSTNYDMRWFVRYNGCQCGAAFSTTNDGTVITGSIPNLMKVVTNAAGIRIVNRPIGAAFPLDNVAFVEARSLISGQSIWQVSQLANGDHYTYETNASWVFKSYTSLATEQTSRWSVGTHVSTFSNTSRATTDWYVDDCWKLVYTHKHDGTPVTGTRNSLIDAVNEGHRIKVVFAGSSFELNTVYVKESHVFGQIINKLGSAANGASTITFHAHWDWKMVDTTGRIHTVKYLVGEHTKHAEPADYKMLTSWYVDDREWVKVLQTSSSGTVTSGSKAVLEHAIRDGAEVRVQELVAPSGAITSKIHTVDNVEIKNGNVGAMHVREVSIDTTTMKFQVKPYWFFSIVDTNGMEDVVRWTVGQHEDRGRSKTRVHGVIWFVNK